MGVWEAAAHLLQPLLLPLLLLLLLMQLLQALLQNLIVKDPVKFASCLSVEEMSWFGQRRQRCSLVFMPHEKKGR